MTGTEFRKMTTDIHITLAEMINDPRKVNEEDAEKLWKYVQHLATVELSHFSGKRGE